ncbi:MAG: DHA2 family efflux MFS transporter permease subunit [Candidatus Entotheonellia bacterium]
MVSSLTHSEATVAPQNPLFKWWIATAVIFGAITMDFGGNVLNVAVPKMMTSFGVSLDKIQWVLTGYVVARAVLMPTVGWLGGWIGQRNLYLLCLLFVVGSSVLGGAAWNLETLIVFRVLQGIGAGPLQALGLVILFENFPPHQRGLAVGLVFIGYSIGAAIAYILGGYLIEHYSWRAMFYLAAPPGVLSLVLGFWILPNDRGQRRGTIDYWGLLFMSLCLSTLLLALTQGRRQGWDSFYIRTLFAIAGPSFLVFILIEMYTRAPIVHLGLYRNLAFTMASLASCLNSMSIHSMQFLTALFLQQILGLDALQTGMIILPSMLLSGVVGPVVGSASDRVNPRIPVLVGFASMSGLFYGMSYANALTTTLTMTLIMIGMRVALNLIHTPLTRIAMGALDASEVREGTGLEGVVRGIGGAFGVALTGVILEMRHAWHFGHLVEEHRLTSIDAIQVMEGMRAILWKGGAVGSLVELQARSWLHLEVERAAQIGAFQDILVLLALLQVVALVPTLLMRSRLRGSAPQRAKSEAS